MSRYSGPQGRGASRKAREQKRVEAEVRNEAYQAKQMSVLTQDSDVVIEFDLGATGVDSR